MPHKEDVNSTNYSYKVKSSITLIRAGKGASNADQSSSIQHRARACAPTGVSPMTASSSASSSGGPSGPTLLQGIDRVRARVAVFQPLTQNHMPHVIDAARYAVEIVQRPPIHRDRGLHPGDVLYWVTCLGGACLFLIATAI